MFFFKDPTQQVLWMPKNSPTQLGSTSIESHLVGVTNPFQYSRQSSIIFGGVQPSLFNHHLTWDLPKVTYRPLGCKIGTLHWTGEPSRIVIHPSRLLRPSTPSLPSTPRNSLRSCWRHCFQLRAPPAKPIRPLNTGAAGGFLGGSRCLGPGGFPVGSFRKKDRGSKWGFLSSEIFFSSCEANFFFCVVWIPEGWWKRHQQLITFWKWSPTTI